MEEASRQNQSRGVRAVHALRHLHVTDSSHPSHAKLLGSQAGLRGGCLWITVFLVVCSVS